MYPKLVHEETIDAVTREWPRKKWSSCFGATIRKEVGAKPWCHSTHIEGFAEKVEGNSVMEKWD
jgi:cyanamide hydratase